MEECDSPSEEGGKGQKRGGGGPQLAFSTGLKDTP